MRILCRGAGCGASVWELSMLSPERLCPLAEISREQFGSLRKVIPPEAEFDLGMS